MDLLEQYQEDVLDIVKSGAKPGWNLALLKEHGLVPDSAIWLSVVTGPDQSNVFWSDADKPTQEDWVKI